MNVIGFFGNVFEQFGSLTAFVMEPINNLIGEDIGTFGTFSIAQLLSISLIACLSMILLFRVIRLFVGG